MFPQLARFQDLGLLLLRLMVAAVFLASGWSDLTKAEERSKSIGMSNGFTMFLGTAEVAGALGVAFGVLTQAAAAGLILIMQSPTHRRFPLRSALRYVGREASAWDSRSFRSSGYIL